MQRLFLSIGLVLTASTAVAQLAGAQEPSVVFDHRLLATNKTSTMQKEMREAAEAGYRFAGVMGGETSFGGSEVVVVMSRNPEVARGTVYDYQLLATNKTSTMQQELQEAGDAGYAYVGQTVFGSAFGGDEVVVILERGDSESEIELYEFRLLGTKKTSTMQKELNEAGAEGFAFVGFTVSSTTFGGTELVSILRRRIEE